MASAADVMAINGLSNSGLIVQAAALEGLDGAVAAVCIQKETGGRNIWGHDPVYTGGLYDKGGPVTRVNYLAYREHRGTYGNQGAGPCQLTHPSYQDDADAHGGTWDPLVNMRTGFRGLARLQRTYGVRDGFRRYNGSGTAAENYANDAMAKLATWRKRLSGSSSVVVDTGPEIPAHVLREVDEPMAAIPITVSSTGHFTGSTPCEAGTSSLVIAQAWLVFCINYGAYGTVRIGFLDDRGLLIPKGTAAFHYDGRVSNNRRVVLDVPSGCVIATVDGSLVGGAIPSWAIFTKPK